MLKSLKRSLKRWWNLRTANYWLVKRSILSFDRKYVVAWPRKGIYWEAYVTEEEAQAMADSLNKDYNLL
jgi:hypothetical protein